MLNVAHQWIPGVDFRIKNYFRFFNLYNIISRPLRSLEYTCKVFSKKIDHFARFGFFYDY